MTTKKDTDIQKIENSLQNLQKWDKHMAEDTPKKHVKTRPGAGGKSFSYVETGYIVRRLNELFNYMWTFKVKEEKIYTKVPEVSVLGELTVWVTPTVCLVKEQYGSNKIKISKDGKPLSISDDKKGAASDALKKCASLFGIASDIYWGGEYEEQIEEQEETKPNDVEELETIIGRKFTDTIEGRTLMKAYFALSKDLGIEANEAKESGKKAYNVESFTDLSKEQLTNLVNAKKKAKEKKQTDLDIDSILGDLDAEGMI